MQLLAALGLSLFYAEISANIGNRTLLNFFAGRYQRTYGHVPTFKAGLHFGRVMTGEIGGVKKEIFFTGDVLNATARIQGLCNSYGGELLLSGELLECLPLGADYTPCTLGTSELRGRKQAIALFTVEGNVITRRT